MRCSYQMSYDSPQTVYLSFEDAITGLVEVNEFFNRDLAICLPVQNVPILTPLSPIKRGLYQNLYVHEI